MPALLRPDPTFYPSPRLAMEATSTPRVTAPYLESCIGRNVIVVGRVTQLRGDTAIVDADGQVTANLNRV